MKEELIKKFAERIDKDKGYDNLKLAEDLVEMSKHIEMSEMLFNISKLVHSMTILELEYLQDDIEELIKEYKKHRYDLDVRINNLCKEHLIEGVTGALNFKSPFYRLICSELGIKYKELSRIGKVRLRANAIETACDMVYTHAFREPSYYYDEL